MASLLFYSLYIMYFERQLESKRVVNEISTMKIDSSSVDSLYENSELSYNYYTDKYQICVSRFLPKKFHTGRDFIVIIDVNGDIVFSYDTKYNRFGRSWKSDYVKLLNILKIKPLNKQIYEIRSI